MGVDRRDFLKIAGLTSVAGLGAERVEGQDEAYTTDADAKSAHRWALVVDLRKCAREKGCTDCVDACHSTHNVPELEDRSREVKWIWKEEYEKAFPSQENEFVPGELKHGPALVLCNHCDNPPCTRVCPTQATWKREDGIVMMDWHRCIGCRYCVAGCPYGSRSFNYVDPRPFIASRDPKFPTRTKGVVEKCTFCASRLEQGLPPACVEACSAKAILYGDLEDPQSEIRKLLDERFSIRRKPGLGTQPQVYYLV